MASQVNGQILEQHQWQNRIVLILAQGSDNQMVKKQLAEFDRSAEGMLDRKLVVYQVLSNRYRVFDFKNEKQVNHWQDSSELYEQFSVNNADFQVVLIGLDGGKKAAKYELITTQDLFGRIDQMPMRQSELRRKKGK